MWVREKEESKRETMQALKALFCWYYCCCCCCCCCCPGCCIKPACAFISDPVPPTVTAHLSSPLSLPLLQPTPHAQKSPGLIPSLSETVLGGAAALAQAAGTGVDNACRVANADELRDAITTKTCPVVILTSSERYAYVLTDEIVISRPVVVMGNSVLLPYIDCADSIRGFRVVPGGYLDLQFVRINVGKGIVRPRWGLFRKQKTRRNMQGEEVVLDEEVSGEEGNNGGAEEGREEAVCACASFPSSIRFASMSPPISPCFLPFLEQATRKRSHSPFLSRSHPPSLPLPPTRRTTGVSRRQKTSARPSAPCSWVGRAPKLSLAR